MTMLVHELVRDLRDWDFSQGGPWSGHARAKACMKQAADEIERLTNWADGFSDAQLKERRLCEERIAEMRAAGKNLEQLYAATLKDAERDLAEIERLNELLARQKNQTEIEAERAGNFENEIDRLKEMLEEASRVRDALTDSAYIAGAKHGYQLGLYEDQERLHAVIEARNGRLGALRPLTTGDRRDG
jgi:predicted nucleic acid-binding protein